MSVTYRGTPLPEANTQWGAPTLKRKGWTFFGVNGANSMHGGTGARVFSVSGICPIALNDTLEGWLDGATGDAVIDGSTKSKVIVAPSPTFGKRFKDAKDSVQYNSYTVFFIQLRT